ncbi:hypothetical protein C467_09364 [Halorubrum hochstenium ATCC 700873]|uniref:Uncharacterized protein n=1 Tax=Halorubrum hochstenium ATCC 700873 TaxID=1227481 RepID=M0F7Z6_9EURY|nr:hypothetical protein C467_09364 [Halorubrum hochstenium ATCC 700873]
MPDDRATGRTDADDSGPAGVGEGEAKRARDAADPIATRTRVPPASAEDARNASAPTATDRAERDQDESDRGESHPETPICPHTRAP